MIALPGRPNPFRGESSFRPASRLELPPLVLRVCTPEAAEPHELLPDEPRQFCRWEVYDDAGEIVSCYGWHEFGADCQRAALLTMLHGLDCIAAFRVRFPSLTVEFPEFDNRTKDVAFTMLRRRQKPECGHSFATYLAV